MAPEATLELMKATEKYDHIMAKLTKLGAKKSRVVMSTIQNSLTLRY